jgi:alanine racemase
VPASAIVTVAGIEHVLALKRQGWTGQVSIKLASSMRRYGVAAADLPAVVAAADGVGLSIEGFALHLPLAGSDESRLAEVEAWLPALDPALALSVSHLAAPTYAALHAAHPERTVRIRCGTALWHADKRLVHLSADVIDVRAVAAGSTAGYHATMVPGDGHLVLVAAGSAHGVRPFGNGLSPFHFARQRVPLLEGPHMHTSILFVAVDLPLPSIGERVDVQRPLIETMIDELAWVDD